MIKVSKEVLIISQYFRPDITAAAFRIEDLCKSLEKSKGIKADIITTYPHKSDSIQDHDYKKENNITRIRIPKIKGNKFLKYIVEYFYFVFMVIIKGVFSDRKKYDYIFITSPPLFIFISGYILAKIKGSKLIMDIRDIWPDSAVAAGMIERNSILYKIARKLELFAYKHADYIFCVSKRMKRYIKQYIDKEVKVVYNGVSSTDINNIEKEEFNLNQTRRKKIFYAGNIGLLQDIGVLIRAFAQENELQELYEFHVIGGGAEERLLKNYIKENNIKNVNFIGQLSKKNTMKKLQSEADILFLHLKDNEVLKRTIPSKVFDYLLLNKPIIYGIDGEGREILNKLNCGVGFECEQVDSLISTLYFLDNKFHFYWQNAKDNYAFVTSNFNRVNLFDKVTNLIVD